MQRQVDLHPTTWRALEQIALNEGSSVAALIRDAVKRDLFRRSRAKKTEGPDERLIAPLRSLLADDFAYAQNWHDLHMRLRIKGYDLRESGGGVALYDRLTGAKLCKGSDIGYSLSRLSQRFGHFRSSHHAPIAAAPVAGAGGRTDHRGCNWP